MDFSKLKQDTNSIHSHVKRLKKLFGYKIKVYECESHYFFTNTLSALFNY